MPVLYTIDAKEKLIRTRCIGNITFDEVVSHFRELEGDPNSAGPLDVLLDLSETGSLPDSGQIAAVAEDRPEGPEPNVRQWL